MRTQEHQEWIEQLEHKNRMADLEYVEGLKEYNKKQTTLDTNIESAYSLVWEQCTRTLPNVSSLIEL